MMQRILNNRQGVILGITGLFLLILVFYVLAIRPKAELWNTQDLEITSLQQQNALLQSKLDERTQEQSGSMTDENIKAALPPGPDAEQLILDMKRIGEQASVRLSDATFSYGKDTADANSATAISKALSAAGLGTVYVTVNVEGNYMQLRSWIDLLQKTERVTTVDAISFQQSAQPNQLLSATITFTASYLPAAETTTSAAEAGTATTP